MAYHDLFLEFDISFFKIETMPIPLVWSPEFTLIPGSKQVRSKEGNKEEMSKKTQNES